MTKILRHLLHQHLMFLIHIKIYHHLHNHIALNITLNEHLRSLLNTVLDEDELLFLTLNIKYLEFQIMLMFSLSALDGF